MMLNKNIILVLAMALSFFACEEKTFDPTVNPNTPPTLVTPSAGASFVLVEGDIDNQLSAFEWTEADFGYQAAVTYTLEFDVAGNNFENPTTLGSGIELSQDDVTVGQMNNILNAQGYPANVENALEIRVCASVSDEVATLCSEAIIITVNPFAAEVDYAFLTVPGDYQGWDPADESTAIYSRSGNEIYSGYIYFPMDEAMYKFAKDLGWDTNWGDDGNDGTLNLGGVDNNMTIEEGAGMYLLTADLNALTHSNMKTNWGVIGDATPGGWDADTDFEWDADREVLTVTLDLEVGNIKFRANDAWDLNYGDDFTNGTLEQEGADIPIESAGNYTIDLILNAADYSYTLTKN